MYLRRGQDLIAMREQEYEAETVLQELLAQHPELLVDEADERGLLLVRREAPLVDDAAGLRAGWLDHLFLDGEGVPTLVEVKRSGDTRIRREVVGQMLEYAANAAACWQDDALRAWLEERCAAEGADPEQLLLETFPAVEDVEQFWTRVRTNLAAKRLRLVFVADAIPPNLRRIIEFLNEQMHQAEVIAVEVRQFVDERGETHTIVPQVLGRTEAAQQAKGRRPTQRWDRASVLAGLRERHGEPFAAVGEALFAWAAERGLAFWFGNGRKDGSFQAGVQDGPRYLWPFVLYTYGRVEINFQYMARRPPFADLSLREELRRRLNEIEGVEILPEQLTVRPSIDLALLTPPVALERFLAAMDWAFAQLPSGGQQ